MPTRDISWQSLDYTLATVSLLYYRDGLTQEAIAKRLGLSRPTIVNYLRRAREEGITEIRIAGTAFAHNRLSADLCERFGLTDVYLAPAADEDGADWSAEAALPQIARIGAMTLCEMAVQGDRIGIVWGATLDRLAREMPNRPVPDLAIYQVIGAMRSPLMYAAEYSAIRISTALGAACNTLSAPAVVSSPEIADTLKRETIIAEQLAEFDRLTKIVFSVGATDAAAHIVKSGVATAAEMALLRQRGATGVICGMVMDRAGAIMDLPVHRRMIGITPAQIRAVPMRVVVAGGASKTDGLRAALQAGWGTHLVTDEGTARALLSA